MNAAAKDVAVIPPTAANQAMVATHETASSAVAAQAKALVEARYTVALHRPRDLDTVRERMLKECRRPTFADVARYRKPIGQGVEGPSIRFAEMAVRCMTNITVETMTVYDDREKRIVRVTVTDLESNVPYSQDVTIEKTVERRNSKASDEVLRSRLNSSGQTVHIIVGTEDDILNKQNALISKAVRTLGLRLVPGDIVDECMTLVKKVQRDQDAADPDQAKRRLFDAFAEIGIKASDLKEYLGNDAATLTPKELADLRGIYAAIRDSETNWREVMDNKAGGAQRTAQAATATGGVGKLKDAVTGSQAAGATEGAGGDDITFEQIETAMKRATSVDQLNDAADLIRELKDSGQRKALTDLYNTRLAEV